MESQGMKLNFGMQGRYTPYRQIITWLQFKHVLLLLLIIMAICLFLAERLLSLSTLILLHCQLESIKNLTPGDGGGIVIFLIRATRLNIWNASVQIILLISSFSRLDHKKCGVCFQYGLSRKWDDIQIEIYSQFNLVT